MTEAERLLEWVKLLDEPAIACLVEVAAILLADQYGLAEFGHGLNPSRWDDPK